MANIKTVTLDGIELKVGGLDGQNAIVRNLGDAAIYASVSPGVTADADGVAEIPAGGGVVLYDTRGAVYLSGKGKAQLTGTDYNVVNFKVPSSSDGGGGVITQNVLTTGLYSDDGVCEFMEVDT